MHGNEVVVMQNTRTDYIDLISLDLKTRPILEAGGRYGGTNRTPLARLYYDDRSPLAFRGGVHLSCNFPGYCVVSTYTPPEVRDRNWLERAILLVKLDPQRPEAHYLAKVHNTTGVYWEETQAAISHDGSKVVWADNWNEEVGHERCFLMQLDVPPIWRTRAR